MIRYLIPVNFVLTILMIQIFELSISNTSFSPITPNDCQLKLNQSQNRNILITNVNFRASNMSNFRFDTVYDEFDQGLILDFFPSAGACFYIISFFSYFFVLNNSQFINKLSI